MGTEKLIRSGNRGFPHCELSMYNNPRHQMRTIWYDMMGRCYKPAHKSYKNYGARGITVCARWQEFENFVEDMGPYPGKGYGMERVKNHLGYSPTNVIWATYKVNNRNRRGCLTPQQVDEIRRLYRGDARKYRGSLTQQDLANRYGVVRPTISHVLSGRSWT